MPKIPMVKQTAPKPIRTAARQNSNIAFSSSPKTKETTLSPCPDAPLHRRSHVLLQLRAVDGCALPCPAPLLMRVTTHSATCSRPGKVCQEESEGRN